ncbi:MAG: hypothetical protein HY791_14170 [Deltaproteobacteria bacterium]|nr:hypothetical protein [Deltaproteobacteria bacterium]
MSDFNKQVTGAEMAMIAYNEHRAPFVIQFVLELEHEPSPDELYEALAGAAITNPGSSLRLEEAGDRARWVIGPPPALTVVDAPDWDGRSHMNAPFLSWPIDLANGPTCELLSVRGRSAHWLVFRGAHAVMDGQGTLAWAHEVFRCLRGEEPIGHPSTLEVDALLREIRTAARLAPPTDALHPCGPVDMSGPDEYHWTRVTADRPLDSRMLGRLMVGLAERAREYGDGPVRFLLPTDIRHYRPDARTTGNFFNSLFVEVPRHASPDMIALRVVQLLYKEEGKKSLGLYSGDRIASLSVYRVRLLWELAHLHDAGRYGISATMSQLGQLERARLSAPGCASVSAFFVPLIGDASPFVNLNGFERKTEATIGVSARFLTRGQLEGLRSELVKAISDQG